jgi:hypothetical protein
VIDELVLEGFAADYEGDNPLAEIRVGQADDGGFGDSGVVG